MPTTKSFFENISHKARLFLPLLFLSLLLSPQLAQAQSVTRDFTEFICLFQKTIPGGVGCSHDVQDQDIENAQDGGILYKQPATVTDKGIKEAIFKISLFSEIEKEGGGNGRPGESAYFYSRVGDGEDDNFFVKISYTDPITNASVNNFKFIKYKRGKPQSRTFVRKAVNTVLNVSTFGIKDLVFDKNGVFGPNYNEEANKLSFYIDGPSGYELVERQNRYVKTSLLENGVEVPFGATVTADFWYCGGQDQDQKSTDGRYAPRDGQLVEYFTEDGKYKDYLDRENDPDTEHTDGFKVSSEKCDGDAAYKIGKTITFKLPETKELADQASAGELDPTITGSKYIGSVLPICSIDPFSDGSVMGCVAQILYGGIFRPVAFFAQLMGKLFDFFLGYSLSDESYRHDFVQTGWQLVRDISNIFFIIIMVWSGLVAVFNTSNVSYKKVIPTLIINALIINFSLFATRIVIDISNITARIFYNQMVVKVNGQATNSGDSGYKPISESIVSSFNPQKIFEGSVLTNEDISTAQKNKSNVTDSTGSFNSQSDATYGVKFKRYSSEYAGYFALVTLVAIAISFGVAMMFWKTAFMFIGRVIGLYVAMIFSPFAFLSRGSVPLVSKIEGVSYASWWKDLTQYALLAPIFVFFLYIINSFLNVEFFNKVGLDQNGQGFFGSVMYVMIPMLIIYGLVTKAVGIAKRYSGEFGEMAQKFATKATSIVGGAALGVASGGLAFAGTRGAGLLRLSEEKRASLALEKAKGGVSGRIASLRLGLNDRAQSGSFDFRKTQAFGGINKLTERMGVKLEDKISGNIGLGSDATKGGMKAIEKKEKKEIKAKIESIKTDMKDPEAEAFWNRKSIELAKKEEQRLLKDESALAAALIASGKTQAEVDAMKANNTFKASATEMANKKIAEYGTVKNNKQLTQAMRIQFAETIADGKTLGQSAKAKVLKGLGVTGAGLAAPGLVVGAAATPISAAALMTGVYDSARSAKLEKEEAKSYAKKAKEAATNKNKLPKEDRLEIEKKTIEKELESIDKTLKDIFAEEIRTNTTHAGKTPGDIMNDPGLAEDIVRKARRKMKDDMDIMDIDIEFFKKKYHDAMTAGDTNGAATAKASMVGKITEKNELNEKHFQSNPDTKLKKQADLNKKDDELEKIKEKREKDSEKDSDKEKK